MRILSIRPSPGGGAILARLDVELTSDVRLKNLALRRTADGRVRIFAPNVGGANVATFSPEFAARLVTAALTEMEGRSPHEKTEAA